MLAAPQKSGLYFIIIAVSSNKPNFLLSCPISYFTARISTSTFFSPVLRLPFSAQRAVCKEREKKTTERQNNFRFSFPSIDFEFIPMILHVIKTKLSISDIYLGHPSM